MGASSWTSRVPYQDDLEAALQQAREEAYRDGDYYREEPDPRLHGLGEQEYVAVLRAEYFLDPESAREAWQVSQAPVTGPDSLLAAQPDSGAHSVIDMTAVSRRPELGAVAPLPDEDLDRWFSTRRPDAAAVERALRNGLSGFERWSGAYVIAYAGDRPESIYFFGWSGD
ncbi:hypothetical protein AB0F81_33170 [Actinoplanes sp. NPDC024001]|uniref:hypothetical protein n=1 Tax=Actinoplanes sp. NPDC024001 TaxID=3154598 RepID=UPI0033C894ED